MEVPNHWEPPPTRLGRPPPPAPLRPGPRTRARPDAPPARGGATHSGLLQQGRARSDEDPRRRFRVQAVAPRRGNAGVRRERSGVHPVRRELQAPPQDLRGGGSRSEPSPVLPAGPGGGGGRSRAQVLPEGGSGGGGGHQQGDVLAVEPDHVPDGAGEGEGAGRWVSEDGGECFGGNGRIQGVGSLPFPEIPPGGDRV
ncbi:unnamed protein product [Linum tenue]|uniref:Uncharacterized protein n=1 Tax=Linum tenue TaxID=586396 RepID=A0AAV0N721_9ROSI|nr:unnamed protein product [Linum tenue]